MTQVLSQHRRTAHFSDKHRVRAPPLCEGAGVARMGALGIKSATSDYQQSSNLGISIY